MTTPDNDMPRTPTEETPAIGALGVRVRSMEDTCRDHTKRIGHLEGHQEASRDGTVRMAVSNLTQPESLKYVFGSFCRNLRHSLPANQITCASMS